MTKVFARDLMRSDVLRFSVSTPIDRAVEQMEELRVSGAPVIDTAGRLVGVISASDIVRAEHVHAGRIDDERGSYSLSATAAEDDDDPEEGLLLGPDDYSPVSASGATVGEWMNPDVVQVTPDASLGAVCRKMIEHDIHRVLVVEGGALRGIVTSFDVVRHVARTS